MTDGTSTVLGTMLGVIAGAGVGWLVWGRKPTSTTTAGLGFPQKIAMPPIARFQPSPLDSLARFTEGSLGKMTVCKQYPQKGPDGVIYYYEVCKDY